MTELTVNHPVPNHRRRTRWGRRLMMTLCTSVASAPPSDSATVHAMLTTSARPWVPASWSSPLRKPQRVKQVHRPPPPHRSRSPTQRDYCIDRYAARSTQPSLRATHQHHRAPPASSRRPAAEPYLQEGRPDADSHPWINAAACSMPGGACPNIVGSALTPCSQPGQRVGRLRHPNDRTQRHSRVGSRGRATRHHGDRLGWRHYRHSSRVAASRRARQAANEIPPSPPTRRHARHKGWSDTRFARPVAGTGISRRSLRTASAQRLDPGSLNTPAGVSRTSFHAARTRVVGAWRPKPVPR